MRWWEERVVPRLVQASLRGEELAPHRDRACAQLSGAVLELGFGSGLNLAHCPPGIVRIDAVEPSDLAWRLSQDRRAATSVPVTRVGLDGQRVDADDATYDAVLSTFTFCTIPDPMRALSEVRRVLRPGGALFFLEHGLAPTATVRRWQRRCEPVQRRVAGGCHLTRDLPDLVTAADFDITDLEQGYLPGPRLTRPFTYCSAGRAVVRTG
ncbi:class I SAM-dependent methyltransferase [Nocardioides sp. cx-169]|uniref:class I SAM-dependent methyltransferase n=1 Tax=Nocardioides sp. cx-169 TaxID=2899080 RepID=UPI001E397328|nr:class I SAM-dependent methyltransferase [Nocardioides sp. cx-169]MCD4535319.1 class I SAM-dependent methyltransferase [Nocardioides sp. cx-169]